jgi:membrane-bound lytic murein transglycosylase
MNRWFAKNIQRKKNIYKVEPSFWIFFKERGARSNWGTYYALNGHIALGQGGSL